MAPKKRKKKDKSPTQNNQYHKCTVYSRNKALIYYNINIHYKSRYIQKGK